jgi:hypothetical protein
LAGVDLQDQVSARQATSKKMRNAAEGGYKEIVELLIAKGSDIDARRKYPLGDTPLHSAARKGHVDIVDLLISKGANVNATNNKGEGPTKVVGSRNRQGIIDLLKKHGATEEPPQTMKDRFQSMSEEERERLREKSRERFQNRKKQETKE